MRLRINTTLNTQQTKTTHKETNNTKLNKTDQKK